MPADRSNETDATKLAADVRAMTAELGRVVRAFDENIARGQMQTVIHKSNMGGFVAGIAVAACICSMFVTMFIARSIANEMRDVKAWQDVMRGKITVIEGKMSQPTTGAKP